MLKNYYDIDENIKLSAFLKEINEKKNSHYIILNTNPKTYVDIRTIALKVKNLDEKLKNFKKRVVESNSLNQLEILNKFIESGERIIKVEDKYYDFIDALVEVLDLDQNYLDDRVSEIEKKEIYALNEHDKISSARNLFLKKRINLLPVIEGLKVTGELRPIDFLLTELFDLGANRDDTFSDKEKESVLNTEIANLVNRKPIIVKKETKIRDLVKIMIDKKLPSIIVIDEAEKLYSVISYTDIFKLYKKDLEESRYLIEYSGADALYDDDFDLIQDFAIKTMKKIVNLSDYDLLKINFKSIGDKDAGHRTRFIIKVLLAEGNKVIQVEKEISSGTSDEIYNDKVKERWNVPLVVQQALSALEKKVKEERRREKVLV